MSYPTPFIQLCSLLELKLTSLRREVLFILWQAAAKPLKAYEVLDNLLKTKLNAKPPSVYRALLFFVNHGVVHKIESIQSYTLCCSPARQLASEVLMVCDKCHNVSEIHDKKMQTLVSKIAIENAFKLRDDVIELKGLCYNCQK
jgi:Fur family zinc uptake transcriptional regulator